MSEELVDVFTDQGEITDRVVPKTQAHLQGLWHLSAHVWIYNSKGDILLQKRSKNKDTFPSMWDISVAGHISAGESPLEGALRELREEIGYHASADRLRPIGKIKMDYHYAPKAWTNREHCYVYLLRYDGDIDGLKIQKEELEDIRWFSQDEFSALVKADRAVVVPHEDYYERILSEIVKETD